MINVEKIKSSILLSAMSGKLVESNCNWNDVNFNVPLWSVTAWDKKFKNVDKEKQKQIKNYKYILSNDMFKIARDCGNVYLLSTGQYEGYTTEELAGDYLAEGEVVTLPWGGTPIIKYFKGKFVTSDNRIATSTDINILDNKFLYYFILSQSKYLDSNVYRGTGLRHPEMRKVLDMMIPLPPIEEQKRIVAKLDDIFAELDKIDAYQNKLVVLQDKLENKLLQLAIQGKLVEQRPEEGTGKELFKQIQIEKQELIKQGKIKKEKALAEISDDEIPFEIPSTWKWVRWGEIINIVSARRVHQSDWKNEGVPFYRAREIAKLADNGFVKNDLFISKELFDEFSKTGIPLEGDLMVTGVGTLGKTYIVKSNDRFYYKDASVLCFENYGHIISEFLKILMKSQLMISQINSNSGGTTVSTLTMERMAEYILPLPPLEEQNRIVAKLNELLPKLKSF